MRNEVFTLDAAAAFASPPFSYVLAASSARNPRRWRLQDGASRLVGHAATRAGARAGVRALHAAQP